MTTEEAIISLIISLICTAPLILIGIFQCRSKTPVGFWSGKEPPKAEQISNVEAYNKKHGRMWICYGIGFLVCLSIGFWGNTTISAIAAIAEIFLGLLLMIAYHNKLNRTYIAK